MGKGKIQEPGSDQPAHFAYGQRMARPQKKFVWEIVSIILLSGIITTLLIDFAINRRVTWSEYPAAVSLVIFSYVSLFAFWPQRTIVQVGASLLLSSCFLLILDALTGDIRWSIKLGMPLLLAANLIAAALIIVFRQSKYKGINLIAYTFLGAAIFCLSIEGILSLYTTATIYVRWSLIVAGCIIPVVLTLLFVHFRLKRGRSLEKTFHI